MKILDLIFTSIFLIIICFSSCNGPEEPEAPRFLPLTDSDNSGDWKLREDISDEFESEEIDANKWLIQGTNGEYASNFVGRPPSQFSSDNAIIEDGKLKILTKWEPDYPFSPIEHPTTGEAFENITTAAVVGKNHFKYGYMEVKVKSADAPITSSFWTTNKQGVANPSELDMFEMFGGHTSSEVWKKRLKFNMISWDNSNPYYLPGGNGPAYSTNLQVQDNTADDFHVYGFEWSRNYVKVYVYGELHPNGDITKEFVTENGDDPDRWVTDVSYKIWFDSETFPWLGLPEEQDLPADYEIEYLRVWQKQ